MAERRQLRAAGGILKSRLLGLASFLSYIGGPFYFHGLLMPHVGGKWPAFLITLAPVSLMWWGADEMSESRPSPGIIRAGLLGLVITLCMHLYALWGLVRGLGAEPAPFQYLGIAVGMAWSVAYWFESRRWLGSRGTSGEGDGDSPGTGDPSSPTPIEPS